MSGSFKTGFGAAFLIGAMAMTIASGCGTRIGATGAATPAPADSPSTTPIVPTPMPTPMPTPTPVPVQPAIATVSSKNQSGGSWYCLGLCHQKVAVQVAVTNPNAFEVMADVMVTFTSGGQSTGETQEQTLDLPPDGNKTFQAQATQTSDDATAQITSTEQVSANTGGGMAGAAGYGSPYGGAPGYGTSPSYGSGGSSYGQSGAAPYSNSSYGTAPYGQTSSYGMSTGTSY